VVADVAKLTVGREEYYTRELATDHEQYLSGHGESPGRWYGGGADAPGLLGEASPAGFRRMFEGRYPDTGGLLGRPHGRAALPAFDVVLRPTKAAKATRCCTPISWSPTGSRGRTAAGRPWTAGTCTGPAGRGRHLPGHLPAPAQPDTQGGVDSG
jgi:hypothetical protein